jgi:hypothetical protein
LDMEPLHEPSVGFFWGLSLAIGGAKERQEADLKF